MLFLISSYEVKYGYSNQSFSQNWLIRFVYYIFKLAQFQLLRKTY